MTSLRMMETGECVKETTRARAENVQRIDLLPSVSKIL